MIACHPFLNAFLTCGHDSPILGLPTLIMLRNITSTWSPPSGAIGPDRGPLMGPTTNLSSTSSRSWRRRNSAAEDADLCCVLHEPMSKKMLDQKHFVPIKVLPAFKWMGKKATRCSFFCALLAVKTFGSPLPALELSWLSQDVHLSLLRSTLTVHLLKRIF